MKSPLTLLMLLLIIVSGYSSDLVTPSHITTVETDKNPVDPNVKGFTYNLVAIKGESVGGGATLEYSGNIFLDGRKSYKANYKKGEHFNFEKFTMKDGQVYIIPGYHKSAKLIKHNRSKDYHVALKLGNAWSQYYYHDIMENRSVKVGSELGIKNCNFKKAVYDYENNWMVTAYFEIKPVYYDASKSDDDKQTIYITTDETNEHMPVLIDY